MSFCFVLSKTIFFSVKKIVMYIIYKNMMIIFFLLEVNIAELN